MCLGVPGKVVAVNDIVATVDFWGVQRPIMLNIVDEPVQPGDYVLVHVGFAIRRIPPEDVEETLAYDSLLRDEQPDLLSEDVRNELRASEDRP